MAAGLVFFLMMQLRRRGVSAQIMRSNPYGSEMRPLLHLEGEYTRKWGELMAGYTIASLPLVIMFFFTMKLFIRGLSSGGVKG